MELLQAMQVFVKLAELSSFTKVADSLQVGRPHVTRTIKDLESAIGTRLFQRTTRTVKLTPDGEQFYIRAKEILAAIADTRSMFDRSGSALQGRLRIDIPAAFAQERFMSVLQRFTQRFAGIELSLGVTDRAVDLVSEGVDCALRMGQLPDSSMIVRVLGTATMVTCASPGYLDAHGMPETLPDLQGHRCVSFLSGQNNRPMPWAFSTDGKDELYIPSGGILVNESNAYVNSAVAGFGIIQAPGIAVECQLEEGRLLEVLPLFRPTPRQLSLLYPSKTHLTPQVNAFVNWLKDHLPAQYPHWFTPHEAITSP